MPNNIAAYRRFLGIRQEDLAKMLGISVPTMVKYEKAKDTGDLSINTIEEILDIFNKKARELKRDEVTLSDLMNREER
jgi:transcriptional regulator with XRE-family HTH domain